MNNLNLFGKDELKDIIANLEEALNRYKQMEATSPVPEPVIPKKRKSSQRYGNGQEDWLTEQITVILTPALHKRFVEEFTPLIKEKVNHKGEFKPCHALRYLVFYALKHGNNIRGVEYEELK